MPTGPATGGGAVGSAATEPTSVAEAAEDQAQRSDRLLGADRDGRRQVVGRGRPRRSRPPTAGSRRVMPRAPCPASMAAWSSQGDRDVAPRAVGPSTVSDDGLPGCARSPSRMLGAGDELVALAVDGDDRVAGLRDPRRSPASPASTS